MGRQKRKYSAEFPIQITARTNNREFFFIPMEDVWGIFEDVLYLTHKLFDFSILQFLLMHNHFHMIGLDPNLNLSVAMQFLMRETSHAIAKKAGRINRVWGRPFHSSIITTPVYFLHAYKYNYRNPVTAGICENPLDYPWSTLSILLGKRRGIIPLLEDTTLFEDVEGTLSWLNQPHTSEELETLRTGFRKKTFALGKDRATNSAHPMSRPESLKFTRRVPKW